jgi:hypothetical protein
MADESTRLRFEDRGVDSTAVKAEDSRKRLGIGRCLGYRRHGALCELGPNWQMRFSRGGQVKFSTEIEKYQQTTV